MTEETLNKIVAKIAQDQKITPEAAATVCQKRIDDTKFHIRIFNQNLDDVEITQRAETTVANQIFPPIGESSGSGKRAVVIKGCLVYMLQEREEKRTKVIPRLIARFLFDSGIRLTKSNKPDPKSVGDALGIDGLGLAKQPDLSYPIPSKPEHFFTNKARNIEPPPREECTLDALCRKYEIDSPLVKMDDARRSRNAHY